MLQIVQSLIKKNGIHLIVIFGFIFFVSILYPQAYRGMGVGGGDNRQYSGMAREIRTHNTNKENEPSLWLNNMFGGMPSYLVSYNIPSDYIGTIKYIYPFFLYDFPRPVKFFVYSFVSFYILMLILGVRWQYAALGGIAFSMNTAYILLIEAGHNSKMIALGIMPLLIAGLILLYKERYLWGFVVSTLGMGMQLAANHIQMTYYMAFPIAIFFIVDFVLLLRKKDSLTPFIKKVGILALAYVLALGFNASRLLPIYDHSKYTIRGPSELTLEKKDNTNANATGGLDRNYITGWSLGKWETISLINHGFMGGGTTETLDKKSHLYTEFEKRAGVAQAEALIQRVPLYWGPQPFVSGPIYMGITVFVLLCLALFTLKNIYRPWILTSIGLLLFMAWGKHMNWFTNLMIDYFPLYNKFRTVSTAMLPAFLLIAMTGAFGLYHLIENSDKKKKKKVIVNTAIAMGVYIVISFLASLFFTYQNGSSTEENFAGAGLLEALKETRQEFLLSGLGRNILFIVGIVGALWLLLIGKVQKKVAVALIGILICLDLILINFRYFNDENFQTIQQLSDPYPETEADKQIKQDKGKYRVYNVTVSPMSDSNTPYHHNSIGGYHAAKLRRYQELYDYHISKANYAVLNMLNTRYFITADQQTNKPQAVRNDGALGNVWLVKDTMIVSSANEEIEALTDFDPKDKVVFHKKFLSQFENKNIRPDTTASISLSEFKIDEVKYLFSSSQDQIAVFSEIYYPDWQAYIDGKPADHFQCNYVLRGMVLPKGEHEIRFKFEPKIVAFSEKLTLASWGLFGLIFAIILSYNLRQRRNKNGTTAT